MLTEECVGEGNGHPDDGLVEDAHLALWWMLSFRWLCPPWLIQKAKVRSRVYESNDVAHQAPRQSHIPLPSHHRHISHLVSPWYPHFPTLRRATHHARISPSGKLIVVRRAALWGVSHARRSCAFSCIGLGMSRVGECRLVHWRATPGPCRFSNLICKGSYALLEARFTIVTPDYVTGTYLFVPMTSLLFSLVVMHVHHAYTNVNVCCSGVKYHVIT